MTNAPSCGLYTSNQNPIPLEGVLMESTVLGTTQRVRVTQRYRNTETSDIEAVYIFPLPANAAVCGFEARVGDRLVRGHVQERDEAFETYDDAMIDGHGAFLLDQERPNIFTTSVGNLKAGTVVELSITYVAKLNREGDAIRLMIPTTISPRFTPASSPTVGQPEHERVSPDIHAEVPYGLTLRVHVHTDNRPIESVESPSHTIKTRFAQDAATVTLSQLDAALDRDFVLLIESEALRSPHAFTTRSANGDRFALINFLPGREIFDSAAPCEVVFVVDCSGSMQGPSIEQARRALMLCIRALPTNASFNIIRFGNYHRSLWPTAQGYNQTTLDQATGYLKSTHANMGGTEILRPLHDIFSSAPPTGTQRRVVLLTDGQVSNESDVIALCRDNAAQNTIFSFGIGAGVSEHLVQSTARVTQGASEFIYDGERIEPKVLRMIKRVCAPKILDAQLDWGDALVELATSTIPPIHPGDPLTLLARLKSGSPTQVTLRAAGQSWSIPLDFEESVEDTAVPTLWAHAAIQELEDASKHNRIGSNQRRSKRTSREDRLKERIIALAVEYSLMSSHTSFVAVETRSDADKTTHQAQLRKVPVARTHHWGASPVMGAPSAGVYSPKATRVSRGAPARPSMDSMGGYGGGGAPRKKSASAPRRRKTSAPIPQTPASLSPPPMPAPGAPPPSPRLMSNVPMAPPAPAPAAPQSFSAKTSYGARALDSYSAMGEIPESEEVEASLDELASHGPTEAMRSASADTNALFDLLMTQKADGSFEASQYLLSFLDANALLDVQSEDDAAKKKTAATRAALNLFKTTFAHEKPLWEAAAEKAERWLQTNAV